MMNDYNTSVKNLVHCYQDFLMWLMDYCKEKNPEILNDMGFVGHLERTIAASDNVLAFFNSRQVNRTKIRMIFIELVTLVYSRCGRAAIED
jgi:hypothetical protein